MKPLTPQEKMLAMQKAMGQSPGLVPVGADVPDANVDMSGAPVAIAPRPYDIQSPAEQSGMVLPGAMQRPVPPPAANAAPAGPQGAVFGQGPAPIQGPQFVAGKGFVPTARVTKEGDYVDPTSMEHLRGAQEAERASLKEVNAIAEKKATEQAAFDAHYADQSEKWAAVDQQKQEQRTAFANQKVAVLQNLSDKLGNGEVDPDHYFHSQSTASKIFTGLALALGRIGHTDAVDKMIQGNIDRDVEAQKASFQNRKGALEAQTGLYSQMMQEYKNDDMATAATRATILSAAKARTQAQMGQYAAPEVRAQGEALIAKFDQGIAKEQLAVWKGAHAQATTHETFDRGGYVGGAAQSAGPDEGLIVPLSGGGVGVARSKGDADKLKERHQAVSEVERLSKEIDAARGDPGNFITPGGRAHLSSLGAQISSAIRRAEGVTRLSEHSESMANQLGADTLNPFSRSGTISKEYAANLRKKLQEEEKSMLTHKGDTGYARDKHGNIVTVNAYKGEGVSNSRSEKKVTITPAGDDSEESE